MDHQMSETTFASYNMFRDNSFSEQDHHSRNDDHSQWTQQAASIASILGISALQQDLYSDSATPPPTSNSMLRSHSDQPRSHRHNHAMHRNFSVVDNRRLSARSSRDPYPTASSYTQALSTQLSSSPLPPRRRRASTLQRQSMPAVAEIAEYDPLEYANRNAPTQFPQISTTNPAPACLHHPEQYDALQDLSFSNYQYDNLTPTDSIGNSPTFSPDMSRQSTGVTSSVIGAMDMMKIKSEQGGIPFSHEDSSYSSSLPNTYNLYNPTYISHPTFTTLPFGKQQETFSQTTTQHSFDSSLSPPIKQEQKYEQKYNLMPIPTPRYTYLDDRLLAPKIDSVTRPDLNSGSSCAMIPSNSIEGKRAIPRATPIRPSRNKLRCSECNKHPEGFRGEHELKRHTDRAHPKRRRKVWVCVDTSPDGTFLSKCKACCNKKKYGAYYNAAAHLRRVHFKPREPGPKVKGVTNRAGSGGGDEPPMEYLKQNWMREVEECIAGTSNADVNTEDDSDESNSDTVGFVATTDDSSMLEFDLSSVPNCQTLFTGQIDHQYQAPYTDDAFSYNAPFSISLTDDDATFNSASQEYFMTS